MSVRKALFAAAVGITVGVLGAAPAFGYGGNSVAPTIEVSASEAPPGGSLTVVGQTFTPTGTVSLSLHSAVVQLGTVTADARGQFADEITIPTDEPAGDHVIEALDVATGDLASAAVTVVVEGGGTAGGGGLAGTGVATAGLISVAAVLLLAGGLSMAAGRRRGR